MNLKQFHEDYGPEWRLWVDRERAALHNVVPLYKMSFPMGEWATSMFDPPEPPPEFQESAFSCVAWHSWLDSLTVPPDVQRVACRRRILVVNGTGTHYYDASTNEVLEASALRILEHLWERGDFPEPIQPKHPGFSLTDIDGWIGVPDSVKDDARKRSQGYVVQKQIYERDSRVFLDAKHTIERKDGGAAWAILHNSAHIKVEFLE